MKTTTLKPIRFIFDDRDPLDCPLKKLLQPGDANTKLRKSAGRGYRTVGLSMSPHKLSWRIIDDAVDKLIVQVIDNPADSPFSDIVSVNSCAMASAGCAGACLDHQGIASVFQNIRYYRMAKTIAFHHQRAVFVDKLNRELSSAEKAASKSGERLAARLDVFQDLKAHWLDCGIIDAHRSIQFYDYTAIPKFAGSMRRNYWVTLSRKENNDAACLDALANAHNVAIAFADTRRNYVGNKSGEQQLPRTWNGYQVVDGDTTDLRFDDPRGRKYGRVIGLRLKAHSTDQRQAAIASGFAVDWRHSGACFVSNRMTL